MEIPELADEDAIRSIYDTKYYFKLFTERLKSSKSENVLLQIQRYN
jgi:hypothetical protein